MPLFGTMMVPKDKVRKRGVVSLLWIIIVIFAFNGIIANWFTDGDYELGLLEHPVLMSLALSAMSGWLIWKLVVSPSVTQADKYSEALVEAQEKLARAEDEIDILREERHRKDKTK